MTGIFIHIEKTGGSSVANTIRKDIILNKRIIVPLKDLGHKPAKYMAERMSNWEHLYSFTFVRNPWARIASWWSWDRINYQKRNWKVPTLKEWIERNVTNLKPCSEYIFDDDGNQLIKFIGRTENSQQDFSQIVNKIERGYNLRLRHVNRGGKHSSEYQNWFGKEERDMVAHKVEEDAERFGYAFDKSD